MTDCVCRILNPNEVHYGCPCDPRWKAAKMRLRGERWPIPDDLAYEMRQELISAGDLPPHEVETCTEYELAIYYTQHLRHLDYRRPVLTMFNDFPTVEKGS